MRAVLAAAAALACLPAEDALAQSAFVPEPAFTITSRTIYHAYQVRLFADRDVDAFRNLNRFYQWIEGGVFSVGPGNAIDGVLSIRYDTDFGTGFRRDTPQGFGIPATDGRNDLDLMYLYVDWRDLLGGHLDVRLGRQLLIDDLDWYPIDGVKVSLRAFEGSYVELYAGRVVPYDAILSSEPFINDGVEVSDGPNLALGGALFGRLSADLSFSLAYRHELIFRGDDIEVFGRDPASPAGSAVQRGSSGKIGLQEWLLGGSISYLIRPIDVGLYAHGVWNLLFGALDQARVGAGFDPSPNLHAGLEYLRVRPRFAGDSIFNVFNIFPYDRARAELTWTIVPGLELEAGYFLQQVGGGPKGPRSDEEQGGAGAVFQGSDLTHGPHGGIAYRAERWGAGGYAEAATNVAGRFAYGGNYRRFEIFADADILEERLSGILRLGYTGFQNDWFEDIDSGAVPDEEETLSVDVGGRAVIADGIVARANFVKNFNSLLAGSYRVFTSLEVRY